jgi:hypothetical protein
VAPKANSEIAKDDPVSIQRCGDNEFPLIERFWSRYRAAKGDPQMSAEERRNLWAQEVGNPFQNGAGSCWLASDLGEPVAHLSRSPCPAYHQGRTLDAGWWRDLFAVSDVAHGNATAALMLTVARLNLGHAVLGTPGVESQVGKLYRALRFDYWGEVPFLYLVLHGSKLLRNLVVFKKNRAVFFASNLASRLYLPGKVLELRHRRRDRSAAGVRIEHWRTFPAVADDLWVRLLDRFTMVFDRSVTYLNWRYAEPCYERVGVFLHDQLIGWVVSKLTAMNNNAYFGDLTVGTVVDLLVNPEQPAHVREVLHAAVRSLAAGGADVIVTNLSDRRLVAAACVAGFIPGPSNYHFFTKNLPALQIQDCHLTRGDSDGDRRL